MREDVDSHLARDAALLGQHDAFAEGQHLHGELEIVGNLERQCESVVADVSHLGPDIVEDWLEAIEGGTSAAHHHAQLARFQRRNAAGNRGIDHVAPLRADLLRDGATDSGTHRAHVHHELALPNAREKTVGTIGYAFERFRIGDHYEDHICGVGNRPG
jgi:hypothetical protein